MNATQQATTKHTCNNGNGPAFGRKTAGCPRCDELLAGAAPRALAYKPRNRALEAEAFRASLRAHSCSARNCGPVCTFGDW